MRAPLCEDCPKLCDFSCCSAAVDELRLHQLIVHRRIVPTDNGCVFVAPLKSDALINGRRGFVFGTKTSRKGNNRSPNFSASPACLFCHRSSYFSSFCRKPGDEQIRLQGCSLRLGHRHSCRTGCESDEKNFMFKTQQLKKLLDSKSRNKHVS